MHEDDTTLLLTSDEDKYGLLRRNGAQNSNRMTSLTKSRVQLLVALCCATMLVFVLHTVFSGAHRNAPQIAKPSEEQHKQEQPSSAIALAKSTSTQALTTTTTTNTNNNNNNNNEPVIEAKYLLGAQVTVSKTSVWFSEHGVSQASVEWEMFCASPTGNGDESNDDIGRDCKARVSGKLLHDCQAVCAKKQEFKFVTVRAFDPSNIEDVRRVFKESTTPTTNQIEQHKQPLALPFASQNTQNSTPAEPSSQGIDVEIANEITAHDDLLKIEL